MSSDKHKLIIEGGMMKAKCSCGLWQYIGILAETKKAISMIHSYHADFKPTEEKSKPKKKKR